MQPVVNLTTSWMFLHTIQPAVQLYRRLDNWLYRVSKHPTGCRTGCTTGLTTGWMFVCTMQPVVKPVWQPVVSCKRTLRLKHEHTTCVPNSTTLALAVPEIWLGTQKFKPGHTTTLLLKWFVIRRIWLAIVNPCTKFDASVSTGYEDREGDGKGRKMGGFIKLGVT